MFSKKWMMALTASVLIHWTAIAATAKTFTATKVIDAKGRVVGTILDRGGSAALVGFNGTLFLLAVGPDGFKDTTGIFYWTSADCTGPALIAPTPSSMYQNMTGENGGNVNNNIMYFGQAPITSTNLNSSGFGDTPAEAAADCSGAAFPSQLSVGPVGTFDLATLGFTTPFKAK